jgi:hypothetical protein
MGEERETAQDNPGPENPGAERQDQDLNQPALYEGQLEGV